MAKQTLKVLRCEYRKLSKSLITYCTKMKFSIKDFSSNCDQIRGFVRFRADLVTFTEEILDGKLHFLCSASS